MTPLVLSSGIDEVRKHSTWFLVIGIALVILGMIAIGYAVEMTIVSVIFLGWLLIIGGIFEVIHGFSRRQWSGFFINLLGGVLYAVPGVVMIAIPALAAVSLTLLIAIILIVAGLFRLVVAFSTPLHHRGCLLVKTGCASPLPTTAPWPQACGRPAAHYRAGWDGVSDHHRASRPRHW